MEKCLQCGREKWDPFRCVRSGDRSCFAVKLALAADRARIAAAIREELRKHDVLGLMGLKASRAFTDDLLRVVEGK